MEEVDLGVAAARWYAGSRDDVAVVLPGALYNADKPLLWFARAALQERGWGVLEVWGDYPREREPRAWVAERARAALAFAAGARLLVGKSVASYGTGLAAELELAAVWLTPLLFEDEVVDGLRRAGAPTLLVGGTADKAWRADVARSLPAEILEIPDADHSLEIAGDALASVDALRAATERIGDFVEAL